MDLRLLRPTLFRTLASRRRLSILTALAERPHTPAELARRTGVTEQTVHYHLGKLSSAGLTERRPDTRPWAYHQLTGQGRDLVSAPPSTKPLAALALAAAAFAGVLAWLWTAAKPDPLPPDSLASPAPPPWWLDAAGWGAIVLGVLALLWLAGWWRVRRLRGEPTP